MCIILTDFFSLEYGTEENTEVGLENFLNFFNCIIREKT